MKPSAKPALNPVEKNLSAVSAGAPARSLLADRNFMLPTLGRL